MTFNCCEIKCPSPTRRAGGKVLGRHFQAADNDPQAWPSRALLVLLYYGGRVPRSSVIGDIVYLPRPPRETLDVEAETIEQRC